MEKNGNTLAPGDKVLYTGRAAHGVKLAASRERGEVEDVDPDTGDVRVKFAHHTTWVAMSDLERG